MEVPQVKVRSLKVDSFAFGWITAYSFISEGFKSGL